MAISLAFVCLGFAAVNDFVFKLFARKSRSRGIFVFAVGVVFFAVLAFLPDWWGESWRATLLWGVVCGLFSAVGNLFLIESMSRLGAGLCSTVYRLNLALVVPMAVVLFDESPLWYQWIGVALALVAVLAFMPVGEKRTVGRKLDYVLVILAMAFRAGMGLSYKYAFLAGASSNGVQIVNAWVWMVCGAVYYLWRERRMFGLRAAFAPAVLGYGALSGALVAGIIYFMAASLCLGDASVVLPIQQMSFLATFFLGVMFLKEKVSWRKVFALGCGVAALLLLSCSVPSGAREGGEESAAAGRMER